MQALACSEGCHQGLQLRALPAAGGPAAASPHDQVDRDDDFPLEDLAGRALGQFRRPRAAGLVFARSGQPSATTPAGPLRAPAHRYRRQPAAV